VICCGAGLTVLSNSLGKSFRFSGKQWGLCCSQNWALLNFYETSINTSWKKNKCLIHKFSLGMFWGNREKFGDDMT
jgi:hypothetical protein